jgi:hypothetical protein
MTDDYMTSDPGMFIDSDARDIILGAIQNLKKLGLVFDSGRRSWCERSGQYEIVWMASPQCKGGYDAEECLCLNQPLEAWANECPARLKR